MFNDASTDPGRRNDADYVRLIEGELLSCMVATSDAIRFERFERRVRGGLMHWHFKQPRLAFLKPGPAYVSSELCVDGVAHTSHSSDQHTMTVVPPNTEVQGVFVMPSKADTVVHYSMIFVGNEFLERRLGIHIDRPMLSQQSAALANLAAQLEVEAANRDNLFDLYAEGWACQALVLASRQLGAPQPARHAPRGGMTRSSVRRLDEFIASHLDAELRLADLAEVAGLSKHHFLRAFRQTTGVTPHQHVLAARLREAKRQLAANADRSITDIALSCGFSNSQNFATIFRKSTGLTPSTFRSQSRS